MKKRRKVLNGEKKNYRTARCNKWDDPFFRTSFLHKTGPRLRTDSWTEYKRKKRLK